MRERYDPNWWHVSFDPFLPLSVERNLLVCTFATFCRRHGITHEELLDLSEHADGFTMRHNRHYIVVYDDDPSIPESRRRFTLAHELGHYALRHWRKTEAEEREADCFARNLLAPRLLAIDRGFEFADYPAAFGISAAAARMCELRRMDDERLAAGLYP